MNLPFFIVDDTRVKLEPLADDPNSDYINACYITIISMPVILLLYQYLLYYFLTDNDPNSDYNNICYITIILISVIVLTDNDLNSNYINICYITKYDQTSKYIASQGPIGVNMEEFIRMIWDVDASKIVMLTNLFENAIEKCKQYWPDIGKTQQFGQINMKLIKEEVYAHFTIREIQITKVQYFSG
ncbi:hypothetical protein LOTGIDRAFT_166432 [Lottia gigantea]|uniref:protein-tyrosine-phosphatase n=1 Tax=Lottia gigantea TaxID=225164 RepID=V3ZY37_LOTGI|nr:hypothetical protein LOTGIDRAFT_166432 [Lottia gigantea]ESO87550.1 hypothetical protein LOTGIDRAFT_166432 [Lottia gigantea]